MKFIDDANKEVKWYNRNYCYATTILLILVNIIIFACLGSEWNFRLYDETAGWGDFSFINLLSIMFASLSHGDWEHVLLNMLCFAIIGFALERKYGSFYFLFLILIFAFTAPAMASHVRGNSYHHGFSGVNYALYGFTIVDFVFMFFKEKKNKTNLIIGIVTMVAIYIMMSCTSAVDSFFVGYPYDLIHNMAHYTGFFVGLLLGAFLQLFGRKNRKEKIHINKT